MDTSKSRKSDRLATSGAVSKVRSIAASLMGHAKAAKSQAQATVSDGIDAVRRPLKRAKNVLSTCSSRSSRASISEATDTRPACPSLPDQACTSEAQSDGQSVVEVNPADDDGEVDREKELGMSS